METTLIQKRPDLKKLFIEVVAYAYILVYIYAAIYKLYDRHFFEQQLLLSPLLSNFAKPISYLVPWSEIAVSILLMVPRFRKLGLWLSGGIMLAFLVYIIYILNFSSYIPCGCGGILATMGWKEHLVFNSVFVGLSVLAIFLSYHRKRNK